MANYLVNPPYTQERLGNYERAKEITTKWTPINHNHTSTNSIIDSETSGNFMSSLVYLHFEDGKFSFDPPTKQAMEDGTKLALPTYLHHVISSALLLYRLNCLFVIWNIFEDVPRYKTLWWIVVRHKKTGKHLMFGEYKGAAGLNYTCPMKPSFKKDTLELLNFLVSNECPHPYDKTVAGSVA